MGHGNRGPSGPRATARESRHDGPASQRPEAGQRRRFAHGMTTRLGSSDAVPDRAVGVALAVGQPAGRDRRPRRPAGPAVVAAEVGHPAKGQHQRRGRPPPPWRRAPWPSPSTASPRTPPPARPAAPARGRGGRRCRRPRSRPPPSGRSAAWCTGSRARVEVDGLDGDPSRQRRRRRGEQEPAPQGDARPPAGPARAGSSRSRRTPPRARIRPAAWRRSCPRRPAATSRDASPGPAAPRRGRRSRAPRRDWTVWSTRELCAAWMTGTWSSRPAARPAVTACSRTRRSAAIRRMSSGASASASGVDAPARNAISAARAMPPRPRGRHRRGPEQREQQVPRGVDAAVGDLERRDGKQQHRRRQQPAQPGRVNVARAGVEDE